MAETAEARQGLVRLARAAFAVGPQPVMDKGQSGRADAKGDQGNDIPKKKLGGVPFDIPPDTRYYRCASFCPKALRCALPAYSERFEKA